jgi:hypothetical protein
MPRYKFSPLPWTPRGPWRPPLPTPCLPASLPPCPPFPPFLADPLPPCPPALLSSPAPCPPAPYQARLGREEGGLGHCSGNGLGKRWPERALKKKARACSAAMLPYPCASVQVVRCPPGYQSATIFMETSSSLRALALVPSLEDVVFRVRSRHRDGFISHRHTRVTVLPAALLKPLPPCPGRPASLPGLKSAPGPPSPRRVNEGVRCEFLFTCSVCAQPLSKRKPTRTRQKKHRGCVSEAETLSLAQAVITAH